MRKPILFALAALALLGASFYMRSQYAASAQTQADALVRQDTAGSDPAAGLASLQAYAKSHSGVNVTLTLTGSYTRAQAAAQAASSVSATNSQIYADAQRACGGKTDSITQARCNQDYLDKHLVAVPQSAPVTQPQLASYKHTVRSPVWVPDLAGALLVGAIVAAVMALWAGRRPRRLT